MKRFSDQDELFSYSHRYLSALSQILIDAPLAIPTTVVLPGKRQEIGLDNNIERRDSWLLDRLPHRTPS